MSHTVRGIVEAIQELHRRPSGYQRDGSFTRAQVVGRYAIASVLGALVCAILTKGDVPSLLTSLGGPASAVADGRIQGALGWLLFDLALLCIGIVGRRYFLARFAGYMGVGLWFWSGLLVAIARMGV